MTALHQWWYETTGRPSLFCPMVGTASCFDDEAASTALRDALFGFGTAGTPRLEIAGPRTEVVVPGRASGPVWGGNLSLLAAAAGQDRYVPAHPTPPEGAVGLLEDVGEDIYRLDEKVTTLLRWRTRKGSEGSNPSVSAIFPRSGAVFAARLLGAGGQSPRLGPFEVTPR